MTSEFDDYKLPLYLVAFVYLFMTIFGILFNSLIVITTVQTKSLRSSCNILIAFCAFCDVLHQVGHIPRCYFIYSRIVFTNTRFCQFLQIIPIFGISAGTFVLLSIGIDRFIAVLFPHYYLRKNSALYLTIHFFPIILYSLWHYYLMYAYTVDQSVICTPPEAFHGQANTLWAISSCIVYLSSVCIYSVVWIVLKKQHDVSSMSKIFRSLFFIMVAIVLGWMLTMGGHMLLTVLLDLKGTLQGKRQHNMECSMYRTAFREQIRKMVGVFRIEIFTTTDETKVADLGGVSTTVEMYHH